MTEPLAVMPGQLIKLSVKIKDWTPGAGANFSHLHWCAFAQAGIPGHAPITSGNVAIASVWEKCTEPGLFQNIVLQVPVAMPGPCYVFMALGPHKLPDRDPNNRIQPGEPSRELRILRVPGT